MHINKLTAIAFSSVLLNCCTGNKTPAKQLELSIPITCSGYTYIQNNDQSGITAKCSGIVVSVNTELGRTVRKGDRLAIIENADLIFLQQEYLESENKLEYFSAEYARQGELTVDNATSIKKMQTAKRDFQSAELTYQSLRKQILFLGLNPDSLKPEKIITSVSIRSQRNGIIAGVYTSKGSYIEKGEKLFDVVSGQSLLLKLFVPEIFYHRINRNQRIEFYSVADSLNHFNASVLSLSESIDPVTHMATVIAKPDSENISIISGMSVRANIITSLPQ